MKMKNLVLLFLILICSIITIQGKEESPKEFLDKYYKLLFRLDEPFMLYRLTVGDSFLYLCDMQHSIISIFSKKDGKKIKKFGKIGKGPGDFDHIQNVHFHDNKLYICSNKKLSIFTNRGEMIKEIMERSKYLYKTFLPIDNNYITYRYAYSKLSNGKLSRLYSLLDSNLSKIKDIFQFFYKKNEPKDKNKIPLVFYKQCRKAVVYKDRLYIGCTDLGFCIGVFDSKGNKCYEINKKYEKIKFSEYLKGRILELYKMGMGKEFYKQFMSKREIMPPEYIPAFLNFFIDKEKIYVFKFPQPGGKGWIDVILLDLKGNILSEKKVLMGGMYNQIQDNEIAFHDGKLYLLGPDPENTDNTAISVMDIEAIFKEND